MKINQNAWLHGVLCVGALVLGSVITTPLMQRTVEADAQKGVCDEQPYLSTEAQLNSAIWGRFGGLAADLTWINVYRTWARKDLAGLRVRLQRVGALSPSRVQFWLNGSRMLGYDAAVWRQKETEGDHGDTIRMQQMTEAISFLRQGKLANPGRYEFGLEEAVLRLRMAGDLAGAVVALESIEEMPDLPYFVGRIRGELLVQLGRKQEALVWLREFEQTLPKADWDARHEVVIQRIQSLEAVE